MILIYTVILIHGSGIFLKYEIRDGNIESECNSKCFFLY